MASPHEHLEHAEHNAHAHDPFDKRVAVSVAVVAALLAGISMLGHRKHNEVLQLQGDSNRLQTEASILHTQATDKWGEYQAVNIRDHAYEFSGSILKEMAANEPKLAKGFQPIIKKAADQHGKYKERLPNLKGEAEQLAKTAEEQQRESLKKLDESHHSHHQADRLDFAHLGAEIGIVLCSLTLLTKRKMFWLAGVVAAALAISLTISAYLIPHDDKHASETHSGQEGPHPPTPGKADAQPNKGDAPNTAPTHPEKH